MYIINISKLFNYVVKSGKSGLALLMILLYIQILY